MYTKIKLLAAITLVSSTLYAENNTNVASSINPLIGGAINASSLSGSNFPGATTLVDFVQLSRDTQENPDNPALV